MGKILIKDEDTVYLQPIFEIEHYSKVVNNRGYVINAVDKAISKGQLTIELDKSKLTKKVFSGTSCYMFDRHGDSLTIKHKLDTNVNIVVGGFSCPQYGDKFSRLEGRKYALSNAISNMKLVTSDPNFDDLLTIKRFLQTYELTTKSTPVSYQLMDLWLAVVAQIHPSVEYRDANYIDKDEFNNRVDRLLGKDDNENIIEFIMNLDSLDLSLVDIYSLFKGMMFEFGVY